MIHIFRSRGWINQQLSTLCPGIGFATRHSRLGAICPSWTCSRNHFEAASLQLLPAAIFPYLCLWLSRYPVIPGIQLFSIDKAMDCLAVDISGGELQLERHRNCLIELQFIQQLPPENRFLALSVGKASMRKKYDRPWHVKVCFRQIQRSRCRRNGHRDSSCRCWLLPVSRFLQEVAKVR